MCSTTIVSAIVLSVLSMHSAPRAERATLSPSAGFDLETGYSEALGYRPGIVYDLIFSCGMNGTDFLRALDGTSWAASPTNDFNVSLDVLKSATYGAPTHASGYPDIFHAWRNLVPAVGTVYFVRTTDGNLAKVRIAGYVEVDPDPRVCRNLMIDYVVYPASS